MSQERQSAPSSNDSDESEPEPTSNDSDESATLLMLQMSHEIQSDTSSNDSDESESEATSNPPLRHLMPLQDLMDDKEKFFEIGLPLYQASIKCDWKAAEAILDKNPDMNLLSCRITENGETALHIAASAKGPKKKVAKFVKNLVERMENKDLLLVNDNKNTALYLAAAAGNIETVKIMMEKNREWMEKNQDREWMEKNKASMKKNRGSMKKNRGLMKKNRESMKMNRESMKMNQELIEKNKELMEKNRELMAKNRESKAKNQQSKEKNQESVEKNRKLTEKNQELSEKNQELTEKNRVLTEKNMDLMAKKLDLESNQDQESIEKNQESIEKNQESIQKNQELMDKNRELMDKNLELNRESTEMNRESTEKNRELLTQKNRELTQKNRELTGKNRGLTEKSRGLTKKNRGLTEKNRRLTEKNRSLMETNRKWMEKNRYLDTIPGGDGSVLPLYAAVKFGNKDVAEHLYKSSNELTKDGWDFINRDSLLVKCVESDMFDIAIKIVRKYPPRLSLSRNLLGLLARKPEAFHEKKYSNTVSAFIGYKAGTPVEKNDAQQLLEILWGNIVKLPKEDTYFILLGPPDSIDYKSGFGKIHQTNELKKLVWSHLKELDEETQKIMEGTDLKVSKLQDLVYKYVEAMHLETRKLIKENTTDEDQDLELQNLISENIVKLYDETKEHDDDFEHEALELQELISEHISCMRDKTEETHHSSRVLFIAAEVGNTNFLLELIRRKPDLIWKRNDNNQTIFHVAVKHRREGIYNLLYEIGSMKDMVTPLKDNDGNNMLHLAAMSTKKKNLEDVSGAALRMQRELLWFEEVERMVPPYLRESKNKDGFTPRELFTKEHQDLIAQGEEWMKSTASQCMVVAALIATIVFAAAFTVPGGYHQDNGLPMFKWKKTFVAFVVADAVSLFLSSASILTFLSILTSRYAERDFVAALPMKLMLGLVTLFLSIGTMMVTFSISFYVLYHGEMKWIPIFISGFAVIPAILYVVLQSHLLVNVFHSTYGGKYLFKPENQVLFYENPRF